MSWGKIDDQFHAHRKAKKAWKSDRRALGLHLLAISYCAGHLTDGFVDPEFVEEKLPVARERTATVRALVDAGLWIADQDGWRIHDWLDYNPSKDQVEREREWDRRRKELFRDPELVAAIRTRDKDRCRYCGVLVNWKDRRGPAGGTYDHVIPRGPNSLDNVVVACRRCNNTKGARTPEQAHMPLLPPGQMGASSLAEPSQNGSSSNLARDQVTHPDPTSPDLSPPVAPLPPAGGRTRDRVRFEGELAEFCAEHFPGVPAGLVNQGAQALRASNVEPTVEALRPFVERWHPPEPVEAA